MEIKIEGIEQLTKEVSNKRSDILKLYEDIMEAVTVPGHRNGGMYFYYPRIYAVYPDGSQGEYLFLFDSSDGRLKLAVDEGCHWEPTDYSMAYPLSVGDAKDLIKKIPSALEEIIEQMKEENKKNDETIMMMNKIVDAIKEAVK